MANWVGGWVVLNALLWSSEIGYRVEHRKWRLRESVYCENDEVVEKGKENGGGSRGQVVGVKEGVVGY